MCIVRSSCQLPVATFAQIQLWTSARVCRESCLNLYWHHYQLQMPSILSFYMPCHAKNRYQQHVRMVKRGKLLSIITLQYNQIAVRGITTLLWHSVSQIKILIFTIDKIITLLLHWNFHSPLWESSRGNKCEVNGAEMCSMGDETAKSNYFVLGLVVVDNSLWFIKSWECTLK